MEDDGINRGEFRNFPPPGTEEEKAYYRKVAELWRKAAEDDWRGPVRVVPGWQKLARQTLDKYVEQEKQQLQP